MIDNSPILEPVFQLNTHQSIQLFELEADSFAPFWHYHPEIELTLITQGQGIRFVGDHIESYQAGDLVLVGENLPHHWVSTDQGRGLSQVAVVLQFQQSIFAEMDELSVLHQLIEAAKTGLHFPTPKPSLLEKIQAFSHLPPPLKVSQLIQILFDLSQLSSARPLSSSTKFNILDSGKEQKRINEAIGYIVANLDQKLTVNQMADHCCMVPQAFCRWFRKHTGFSFITYLNKTRVESACQALLTTDLPVKTIAYEVGFGNVSHFHRTFQKYIGLSPLKYRQTYFRGES